MQNKIKFILLTIGIFLFTLIFWKQDIGINSLIFSSFLVTSLLFFFPKSRKSKNALIIYLGTIISSLAIVYHASSLVIFIWIVSLFFLQPFVHYSELRTLLFGGLSGIISYLNPIGLLNENIKINNNKFKNIKKIFKYIRLIFIPLVIVLIFFSIFKIAVPEFNKLTKTFVETITKFISYIFENISFGLFLFVLWSFITLFWFFFKKQKNNVIDRESKYLENLLRKTKKKIKNFNSTPSLKPLLKYENIIALMIIIPVNVLLLIVNFLDIKTIWLGFEYTKDFDLKQFVHSGTYLLVFSMMLSIAIMLFYFRSNLNFYRKNKLLKQVSYLWIFQNFILIISVIIRNLHYIEQFALAYLRIGLFFFLALVVVSLATLIIKIKDKKSFFYIIKFNSWALYIGFVIFSVPDWDTIIAKYNLKHYPDAFVEASFMLTLDEKVYPLLYEEKELLQQERDLNTYHFFSKNYDVVYQRKLNEFLIEYSDRTWFSWNYADYKSYMYFKKNTKK